MTDTEAHEVYAILTTIAKRLGIEPEIFEDVIAESTVDLCAQHIKNPIAYAKAQGRNILIKHAKRERARIGNQQVDGDTVQDTKAIDPAYLIELIDEIEAKHGNNFDQLLDMLDDLELS